MVFFFLSLELLVIKLSLKAFCSTVLNHYILNLVCSLCCINLVVLDVDVFIVGLQSFEET